VPDLLPAVLLGVVQGLTEFLPVSSTAHLTLVPWLLGWQSPLLNSLTFDVALHMGTLAAVLVYFRYDWLRLAGGLILYLRGTPNPDAQAALLVVIGTVPAVVVGLALEEMVETTFRAPLSIALVLGLFSLVIYGAERLGRGRRDASTLGPLEAALIGCGQALALVPGVSRSGATISVGLLVGLERAAAARFSFLLSTPAVAGAGVLKLLDLRDAPLASADLSLMLAGAIAAGVSGWACIHWLLRYLARAPMDVFVYYRLFLSGVVISVALARAA
jgi:undecaprenyl-diphosphatase